MRTKLIFLLAVAVAAVGVGVALVSMLVQPSREAGDAGDDDSLPEVVAAATPGTSSTPNPGATGPSQNESQNQGGRDSLPLVVAARFGPPAQGKYTYQFKGGPRVGIDEVKELDGGGIKVLLGGEEEQRGFRYTYSWGSTRVDQTTWDRETEGKREDCVWDPPLPVLVFPLELGKTWDYTGKCSFEHIFFDLESSSEVLDVEAIEIMGRTVPTWIVQTTWTRVLGQHFTCCPPVPQPNSSVEGEDRYWWSPELGIPVWEVSQRVTKTDSKEEEHGWIRFLSEID